MLLVRHVLVGSEVHQLVDSIVKWNGNNILSQVFELEDALVEDGLYVESFNGPDLCRLVIVYQLDIVEAKRVNPVL